MGFKIGAYATVWKVKGVTPKRTDIQMSISRKNTQTGQYDTDFSGFVQCLGDEVAKRALSLARQERIKLESVDVSTYYNKETNINSTTYKIFGFSDPNSGEVFGSSDVMNATGDTPKPKKQPKQQVPTVANMYDGELDDGDLPY